MVAFNRFTRPRSKPKKSKFPIVYPDQPAEIVLTLGLPSLVELPSGDRVAIWPDAVGGILVARVHLLKRPKRNEPSR